MAEGQRKLPFLSRTRPQWARRSVAGPALGQPLAAPPPHHLQQQQTTTAPPSSSTNNSNNNSNSNNHPTTLNVQTRSNHSLDSIERPYSNNNNNNTSTTTTIQRQQQHSTASSSNHNHNHGQPVSETALIDGLVKRVVSRLPAYSTTVSTPLDLDEVVKQASKSLFELSKRRIQLVLQPLLAELDSLTKSPHYRPDTDFVSVDLLRSQLFLLLTITNCTSHYWVANDTAERRSKRPPQHNNNTHPTNSSSSNSPTSTSQEPKSFLDPPPLDESLAKHILALCVFFLKQHAAASDSTNYSSSTGSSKSGNSGSSTASLVQATLASLVRTPSLSSPTSPSSSTQNQIPSSHPATQPSPQPQHFTIPKLPTTRQNVVQEIFSAASRLVYFLSASNWSIVFGRVKNRISHYATSDELPDSSEMRMLEWCCLDRRRLSSVIQELCNTFIHLKRPAQASMSIVLRRSIWSWIESFGNEFSSLSRGGRRLEGGPEVLFDIIHTLSETSKRKTFAWPVMTMLLTCCPDILAKLAVGDAGRAPGLSKKVQFFETLRKGLKGAKLADVAAACYVDLCRAATCTFPDPSDPSALRLLVDDLDVDLKSKLFDPQRPFVTPEGVADTGLMSEALVSLYRLDPLGIASNPFPSLLDEEAADASKLTAIYSVSALIQEGHYLPWTPSVSHLLDTISEPLRAVFVSTVTAEIPDNNSGRRGGGRAASDEHSERNELVRGILQIWKSDLRFVTHGAETEKTKNGNGSGNSGDSLRPALLAIAQVLDEPNHVSVRSLAVATIVELYRCQDDSVWATLLNSMASSPTLFSHSLSRHVIESKIDPAEERAALEVLLLDVTKHQTVLSSPLGSLVADRGEWAAHWAAMEVALLGALTSSDAENRRLAVQCIQRSSQVVDAIEGLGRQSHSSGTLEAFAAEIASNGTGAGRNDQRRLLRTVARKVVQPTTALLASWDEAIRRWKELSSVIFSRMVDDESDNGSDGMRREQIESMKSPEQQFDEWCNLCCFLLSTSGLCSQPPPTLPRLDVVISPDYLPARFFRVIDRPRYIDRLIQELVDLLVSDSIHVREAVKDALGLDLSQAQFFVFFKHLKSIVGHFFDSDKGLPVTEEAFTVFIEQTVAVLRLMFERLTEKLPKSVTGILDSLLLSFTTYIQRLGYNVQAHRLKISLCKLSTSVFQLRESGNEDSHLRNSLLEHFVGWASDARPAYPDEALEQLHSELDAACLQAMVPILNGLVVHPADSNLSGSPKTDPRLFSRYFDFFAFTLHRAVSSQANRRDGPPRQRYAFDELDSTESRQWSIDALSNLISANPDPAYQQLAEMGTTLDLASRSAYLEALVKVIEKGASFDKVSRPPEDDTYAQIVSLLRQPDLTLAMALCEVCTAANYEDLTEVFLKVFDTPKSIAKFLKAVIEMEVTATDHESTLFRGNSFATRILTAYARARGYHYLRNTLKDLLLTLCKKPHEFSMDFDPHRQTPADDAASRNLEQVTEAFLVCISQSIDQVPPAIREICSHIGEVVGDKFPESIFTAIGGFIFLRFINPAIVSPENIDLDLPTDNRDIRRGLVMITKVLQALANNVRFGAKEPGMRKLNDFMDVNIFGMTRFLQAISHFNRADEPIPSIRDDAAPEDNPGLDEADRSFLHQYLCDNMDKLGMELLQGKPQTFRRWHDGNEGFSPSIGPRTWERITTLIAALGAPPESASRVAAAGWDAPEQAYSTFMSRNELRMSTGSLVWSRVFYETSSNKSGLPTFVMLLHRIKAEIADLESLVFYILQQLAKISGPYEILVDCTKFSLSNEIPTHWAVQLVTILPTAAAQSLSRVFLFGANSLLKTYLRKLGRLVSFERLDSRRAVAVSSISELEQFFHNIDTILPASTVSLAREKGNIFSHITERHQIRVEHPVIFKIGQNHLVITTVKKQDLFSDVKCVLEDVIEFADMEEVRKVVLVEGDGITIRVAGQKPLREFLVSVRRDELFAAINMARSSTKARPQGPVRSRLIPPEDVPAVLVNTVMLNLCSEHAHLRAHGHDLLCSLAVSLKLDGFEEMTTCRGVHVPKSHLSFLTSVSERLASALPIHSLGVLVQFCESISVISASEGSAFVHCLRPWLHNLHTLAHVPRDESDAVQTKLRRCIRQLLQVSVREPALHAILSTRIWPAVGKIEFLIPLLLDESVRCITAYDIGSSSDPCPIVTEILVSLSAGNLLRGRVVSRLRKTLIRSTLKVVPSLPLNPDWPELAALLRIDLALAFDSRLGAQLYLPDVLHTCISLAATGPSEIRMAVQGLLVNTVHSLSKDTAADVPALRQILSTLTGPEAEHLFELTPPPALSSLDHPQWDVATAGQELVALMTQVIAAGAPTMDTANYWRARWTGLSTANCFQYNPSLQPRAYLVIGGVGVGHHVEMDADLNDLIFQILTTLRSRIRISQKNDGTLAAVIVRCLVKILPGLVPDSSFWQSNFWIAMALIQIGNPRIGAAGIELAATTLDGLEGAGWFKDRTVDEVLLAMRPAEGSQLKFGGQLDETSGIDFRHHLSLGIATAVVKHLRHESSLDDAVTLLFKLLLCTRGSEPAGPSPTRNGGVPPSKFVPAAGLGYFVVLLPAMSRLGRLEELLVVAGLDDLDDSGLTTTERYELIASRLSFADEEAAFLTYGLLAGLAQSADTDVEYLAIFTVLRHITNVFPDVATYLYDSVVPVINSVSSISESFEVLDAAQSMMESHAALPPALDQPDGTSALVQLGFAALTWSPIAKFSLQELSPNTVTSNQRELASITGHLLSDILMNPPA
ncbi:hypothetical protein T439DRAFT_302673 [Meredithblackwellia eburnea MCA 4105]